MGLYCHGCRTLSNENDALRAQLAAARAEMEWLKCQPETIQCPFCGGSGADSGGVKDCSCCQEQGCFTSNDLRAALYGREHHEVPK